MPTNPPKSWKSFRLKDGTPRSLPAWANKPLNLAVPPDEALRQGALVKIPADFAKPAHRSRKGIK